MADVNTPGAPGSEDLPKGWETLAAGPGFLIRASQSRATSAGTGQVRFGVSRVGPGLYRWRVSGSTLTLTKIKDGETGRSTELTGTWKHA
jgi:hypothetical protein